MTTHIMSMTYPPKIEGVRSGKIRQTIRKLNPRRPFKLGDKLLIHGWKGKPYRSPWSWRMEAEVKELDKLEVDDEHWVLWDHHDLTHDGYATALNPWDHPHERIDEIAKNDGIVPPTGMGLKAVLESFHGDLYHGETFQVIRW